MEIKLLIKKLMFPGTDLVIRERGRVLKKYLLSEPGIKTLDAGCGNGYFSFLAYELGSTVLGVSTDEAAINRNISFRDYIHISPERVQFRVLNLYDLNELDKTYDQIVCLETLEHVLDDRRVLRSFYERLNDNGRLYLGVPNLNCRHFLGERISSVEDGGHVRKGYSYEQLEKILGEVGFQAVATDKYGGGRNKKSGCPAEEDPIFA